MIQSTKDYHKFKLSEKNREKGIDLNHVHTLIASIKAKNLLEFRPILVSPEMVILDGQHRWAAAKELDVPIYYEISKEFSEEDIPRLNTSKGWGIGDYLNFHVKSGKQEYIKLQEFMKKNNITLKVANMTQGLGHNKSYVDFKAGNFKFNDTLADQVFDICRDLCALIKFHNTYSAFVHTSRFWRAMTILFSHPEFNLEHWQMAVKKMIGRISIRATTKDYLRYAFRDLQLPKPTQAIIRHYYEARRIKKPR